MNAGQYVEAMAVVHGTEQLVCQDIAKRQILGMAKYGVSVADNPLSLKAWMQHTYEECLDMAVYLKRAMQELDRIAEAGAHKVDKRRVKRKI